MLFRTVSWKHNVPSLGCFPPLPQGRAPLSCQAAALITGPLLSQEPDYGALYEGRHPGFYVEANPMPTFKVCPTASCCKLQG